MGGTPNDADKRESVEHDRAQGARISGRRNGEIFVRRRLAKTEGIRAEVTKIGCLIFVSC